MERFSYKVTLSRVASGKREEKVGYARTIEEMYSMVHGAMIDNVDGTPWDILVHSIDHHGNGMATVHLVDYYINQARSTG